MKVHITLVGGQPAPVYHGIVATNPERIVYIYSEQTKNVCNTLKSVIDIPFDDVPAVDSTNPEKIREIAQQLADKYQNDEVTLNISSGSKPWSYWFARVFDATQNASVVYIDQNNVLWNYKTMQQQKDFVFDMDMHFRLYGNTLEHYRKFSDYTSEDVEVAKNLEIARRYNQKYFKKLTTVLTSDWEGQLKNQSHGTFKIDEIDYIDWKKPNTVTLALWNNKKCYNEWELNSDHAVDLAFNSGWFEFKIAHMLSHWKYAKEIRMNCIFPPKETKNVKYPKNEIDIIINTGTKILFVECKTQINTSTDIDKFRTAVKNYGGMGSKALFITDTPFTDVQKEKCAESGILTFSLQAEPSTNKEQALFKLLNGDLFNLNT